MGKKKLSELEKIEEALEANRAREDVIRQNCWNEFEDLMKPYREWMEKIIRVRHTTKREDEFYKQQLDACYKKAIRAGLWKLHSLTDESAKLRTRRCELLLQERRKQQAMAAEGEKRIA